MLGVGEDKEEWEADIKVRESLQPGDRHREEVGADSRADKQVEVVFADSGVNKKKV